MQIKQLDYIVSVEVAERQVAFTENATYVQDIEHEIYRPVIYIPLQDIDMSCFTRSEKSTECPLKGVTDYYDLRLNEGIVKHAAWIYKSVYEYDECLKLILDRAAFDISLVRVIEHTNV